MRVLLDIICLLSIFCVFSESVKCMNGKGFFENKKIRRTNSTSGRFKMARHDSKAEIPPLSQDDIDFPQLNVLEYINMVNKFIKQNNLSANLEKDFRDEYNTHVLGIRHLSRIFSSAMNKKGVTSIDISWPSLQKVAEKCLKKVKTENPEILSKNQPLTLAHLKWIFNEFGNLFDAMKNSTPPDDLTRFGLREKDINLIIDLTIGEKRLFNVPDRDLDKFKEILRYLLINPTGFQRVMSLLTVCVLNENEPHLFENNRTGIQICFEHSTGGSYFPHFHRINIGLGSNENPKNTAKLASTLNHEMNHAYHYMIGFRAKNADKFDAWLSNFSIVNSQKSDYINIYFPMLKKKHMKTIVDKIKELITPEVLEYIKSNEERKNKILEYTKHIMLKGFGNVLLTKTEDQKLKNFNSEEMFTEDFIARCIFLYACILKGRDSSDKSDLLWTDAEEKTTIQGNNVVLIGEESHIEIEDRQNENIFKVRESRSNDQGIKGAQYGYRLHLVDWSVVVKENLSDILREILQTPQRALTIDRLSGVTSLIPDVVFPSGQKYLDRKEASSPLNSNENMTDQLNYLGGGIPVYCYDHMTELIRDIKEGKIDYGTLNETWRFVDTLLPKLLLIDDDELVENLLEKGANPYVGEDESAIAHCIRARNLKKLKKLLSRFPKVPKSQTKFVLDAFIDACPENKGLDSTMEKIFSTIFSDKPEYLLESSSVERCLSTKKVECLKELLKHIKFCSVDTKKVVAILLDNYSEGEISNENIEQVSRMILFNPKIHWDIEHIFSSESADISEILAKTITMKASVIMEAIFVGNSDKWSAQVLNRPDFESTLNGESSDFIDQLADKDIELYNRIKWIRSLNGASEYCPIPKLVLNDEKEQLEERTRLTIAKYIKARNNIRLKNLLSGIKEISYDDAIYILKVFIDTYFKDGYLSIPMREILHMIFPADSDKISLDVISYCASTGKLACLKELLRYANIDAGDLIGLLIKNYPENDANEDAEKIARIILSNQEIKSHVRSKEFLSSNSGEVSKILANAIVKKAMAVIEAIFVGNSDKWPAQLLNHYDFEVTLNGESSDFIDQLKEKDEELYDRIQRVRLPKKSRMH